MIGLAIALAVALLVKWLLRVRKQRRIAAQAADGRVEISCVMRRENGGWKAGRLVRDGGGLSWRPALRGAAVSLPDDLRVETSRRVSAREAMSVNPRAEILECGSAQGKLQLGVLPEDHRRVADLLGKQDAPASPPGGHSQPC
ncbi:hypothetical protein [Streptomyces sp. NPDC017868]|uniref:hypothetical protein n=1 Tax=Streptomyces sp. NPDC017868 TaxID=3365014 RepID=UPI00378FE2CF